ncbi:MAG: SPASM domain-containing protein [Magnetococcales bacterium]|nr:SPASM domain-containing protein [Magnetococcales bacterium]
MKAEDLFHQSIFGVLAAANRKRSVFFTNLFVPGKIWNILKVAVKYMFRLEGIKVYPLVVKIDDSPLCQLKCPVCIHADSETQGFSKSDFINKKMAFDLFCKIVDEVEGKSLAFSFGHMGEPFLNRSIYKMIRYVSDKGISSYVTSNFSMKISDEEMELLVTSAASAAVLMTVALDGFTQEVYSTTRINGNVDMVKDNLERLVAVRNRLGIKKFIIEVQTVEFKHNIHEIPLIKAYCKELGVDIHYIGYGEEEVWLDTFEPRDHPKKAKLMPYCAWPFFTSIIVYDGSVVLCPCYRLHETYVEGRERINVGNVKEASLLSLFNGKEYNLIRRMMHNPGIKDEGVKESFCYRCPIINGNNPEL